MVAAWDKIKEEAKVSPRTRQGLRSATPLQTDLASVGLRNQVEHAFRRLRGRTNVSTARRLDIETPTAPKAVDGIWGQWLPRQLMSVEEKFGRQ